MSRTLIPLFASIPLLANCSSSSSSNGVVPYADGGLPPTTTEKARAFCSGSGTTGKSFPKAVGTSCGAGSNKSLCVMSSSTSCTDALCVWDSAGLGGQHAYCTVACDPAEDGACPSGYACEAQGCTTGPTNVCVMKQGKAATSPTCEAVAALSTLSLFLQVEVRASKRTYLVTTAANKATNALDIYAADGLDLQLLGQTASPYLQGVLAIIGDEVYLDMQRGNITRIKGDELTNLSVTCTAADKQNCEGAPYAIAKSESGVLSVAYRAYEGGYKTKVATFEGESTSPGVAVDDRKAWGRNLDDGTRVAPCQAGASADVRNLCVTRDLVNWETIPLPEGSAWSGTKTALVGASATSFSLITDSGVVLRRVGNAWIADDMPGGSISPDNGFARAGDRLCVTRAEAGSRKAYELTSGCWKESTWPYLPGDYVSGDVNVDYSTKSRCERAVPK